MQYVDGFVVVVPKAELGAYRRMATKASKIWKKHGAIAVRECVANDTRVKMGKSFPKLVKLKRGETVVFSYIVYKSRKERDAVNKSVMKDPKIKDMCKKGMPFDPKRMSYGGFEVIVAA